MENFPIIAVGASAGGIEALRIVLAGLSPSLRAPILVVIHIGANRLQLPDSFRRGNGFPIDFAQDGETLSAGRVYLAPPDQHLMVAGDKILLSHGPRENYSRPAVDPLFRSVAENYGPRAIAIVLSGNLSDGTAGLWEIKRRGGITIVQDPAEAEFPGMPASASQHVQIDYSVSVTGMGDLVNKLVAEVAAKPTRVRALPGETDMNYLAGKPVAFVCPECGGAMQQDNIGTYVRFRCHIGHAYGMDEMAAGQLDSLERACGASLRLLKERVELCAEAAKAARAVQLEHNALAWESAAEESESRVRILAGLLESGWLRPDLGK